MKRFVRTTCNLACQWSQYRSISTQNLKPIRQAVSELLSSKVRPNIWVSKPNRTCSVRPCSVRQNRTCSAFGQSLAVILPPDVLPRATSSRARSCNEPNVGAANKLYVPRARLLTTNRTFYYSAPRLWNEKVTSAQANAKTLESFKDYFASKSK